MGLLIMSHGKGNSVGMGMLCGVCMSSRGYMCTCGDASCVCTDMWRAEVNISAILHHSLASETGCLTDVGAVECSFTLCADVSL